jgi:hypothetical protein
MSKREEEKALEATKKVAEEANKTEDKVDAALTLQEIEGRVTAEEFQRSIHRSLEETKDNIRKSIDEAKSQIPQYTAVVKNYQEQTLQATKETVVDYIEAQKRVIDAMSAVWIPYAENNYRMYSYWFTPQIPTEIYARTVSNIADNITASTRIANNIVFGNIDSFGNAFERAQQNTREISKINVNTAKAFQDTARETARISLNRKREEYIR